MYLSHFGFTDRPFSITPDPRFLYLGERHREALSHLLYGMGEEGGFVQLTGEVGTGKTTLWRYALQRLPPQVDVAVVLNSRLTALELLAAIADELGIECPAGTTSGKVLVDALHRFLLAAHARGRRTVLIIDEAQNLTPDALEQVRMLTNLETPREKLLQIILIGQPELAQLLARKTLRQVAQRITARYHLLPLTRTETRAYVLYRTQVAGRRERVFEDRALDEVYRWSRGVPRLINAICDRALLGAYATFTTGVDAATVRSAAREIGSTFEEAGRPEPRRWLPAAALVATAVITGLVVAFALGDARVREAIGWVRHDSGAVAGGAEPGAAASPLIAPVPVAARSEPPERVGSARTAPDPAPPEALAALLRDAGLASTRPAAFARLHALWGVRVPDDERGAVCGPTSAGGLECLALRGTWRVLSRLDLPAIIELVVDGTKHHAVVASVQGERATLEFGARSSVAAVEAIERFWDGAFTVVWRRPAAVKWTIEPGMRGPAVIWIRRQLAAIDGPPPPEPLSPVYDDDLRDRVIEFQRKRFLHPDGIIGVETLIRLTTDADPHAPSLSRAGSGV
jgi:general secretion pathway protein A